MKQTIKNELQNKTQLNGIKHMNTKGDKRDKETTMRTHMKKK